ncbi:MAG: DUF1080 domain-containing protein [Luteolibacter sp.]|uniref:3-keto-disaccharide hydrolase n=1 Tax=Luteolibacter sp. TaxID=1962973 RepID=UPI0032662547
MNPNPSFLTAIFAAACSLTTAFAEIPTAKTSLFNGKDTAGWVSFLKNNAPADQTWSVKDGLLVCTGSPGGFLRTEKSYEQYKFTVEWRFTKPGNTGVVVHMTPPDAVWPKSIECQGMNKSQGDFYLWSGATAANTTPLKDKEGKIFGYRIGRAGEDAEKPSGEWNTFTVICDKDAVTIFVNGKEVNKLTGANLTSGFIGLQSEGGAFEVKQAVIEPL